MTHIPILFKNVIGFMILLKLMLFNQWLTLSNRPLKFRHVTFMPWGRGNVFQVLPSALQLGMFMHQHVSHLAELSGELCGIILRCLLPMEKTQHTGWRCLCPTAHKPAASQPFCLLQTTPVWKSNTNAPCLWKGHVWCTFSFAGLFMTCCHYYNISFYWLIIL